MNEAIAYRPAQALTVFPIGRTLLFEMIKSGEIESFTVGRARFIPRASLVAFVERQLASQHGGGGA
ncbi:helix-turn-helix domain-containing protein [Nonomuraea sp. NPDC026600]|uniref:helix-turn-helix domain-containing protein n=1 Tax=Nonomuraea sp. NPDC026600 TaxID=3155363 RepID=UPI003406DC6C